MTTGVPSSHLPVCLGILLWVTCFLCLVLFVLSTPDQHRMTEIISHLTRMRFGEEEHSKAKGPTDVSQGRSGGLEAHGLLSHVCVCVCLFQPAGGIFSRLEAEFRSQTKQSSDKNPR